MAKNLNSDESLPKILKLSNYYSGRNASKKGSGNFSSQTSFLHGLPREGLEDGKEETR
jgi:hypothetical protein